MYEKNKNQKPNPGSPGTTGGEYDSVNGRITATVTLAEYRDLVGKAALMTSELEAWALSHEAEGGFRVIDSMRRSVPFVRQAFRMRDMAELRTQVDSRASRRREVWTDVDERRVMAGMRAGEPPEKTAYALRRTVTAIRMKTYQIRHTYPEAMWKKL